MPLVPFVHHPAAVLRSLRDRVLCCATHTAGTPLYRSATATMTRGNTLECLKALFSHLSLQRSVPLGRLSHLPGHTMPHQLRARVSTVPLHPCTFHRLLGSCHFSRLTIFSPPLCGKPGFPLPAAHLSHKTVSWHLIDQLAHLLGSSELKLVQQLKTSISTIPNLDIKCKKKYIYIFASEACKWNSAYFYSATERNRNAGLSFTLSSKGCLKKKRRGEQCKKAGNKQKEIGSIWR